jgi:hypothetical protein
VARLGQPHLIARDVHAGLIRLQGHAALRISGLWIRIDLIRIQHFSSIRIRIQAKTELSKTIAFSNFVEIKI